MRRSTVRVVAAWNAGQGIGYDGASPRFGAIAVRTSSPASGSATDRIHALVITIANLKDGPDAAYRFGSLARSLEAIGDRVKSVHRHGGRVDGLAESLAWLRRTIGESPALAEPAAEGLKAELLILARRIRA
jgi:hypothetical protein